MSEHGAAIIPESTTLARLEERIANIERCVLGAKPERRVVAPASETSVAKDTSEPKQQV